jgi:ribosomal protein L19
MSNLIIEKLLAKSQRTDIPAFHPGDTVRVHVKIKEGDKERVQAFVLPPRPERQSRPPA